MKKNTSMLQSDHTELEQPPQNTSSTAKTAVVAPHVIRMVEEAIRGDRQAFEQIIDIFQTPVEIFVRSLVRGAPEVEDITQDVFLTTYQRLSTLRDPTKFKSWLYRLSWNACMQFFRKQNLDMRALQTVSSWAVKPAEQPEPVSESIIPELFERLAPIDRLILWLRYVDGVPFTEIGPILDMTETSLRQRACRALGTLREVIS